MYVVRVGLVPEYRQYKRQWDMCIAKGCRSTFPVSAKKPLHYLNVGGEENVVYTQRNTLSSGKEVLFSAA